MISKKQVLLLLSLFFFQMALPVQGQIIELWEDGIPQSISAADYQEEFDTQDGIITGLRKVSEPGLETFLPEPGKANGSAVVICPGGGYQFLSYDKEGRRIAQWFNELGVTAFVLKYRLPHDKIMENKALGPLQDAQRALRYVRSNSENWDLDKDKIGIMGFSAGGHLAASLATLYDEKVYEHEPSISARPDFAVLIYPVISMDENITHKGSRRNLLGENPTEELVTQFSAEKQIDAHTPKSFLVHSADDGVVPVENALRFFAGLQEHEVPSEMHIYEDGGHGYGLGRSNTSNTWPVALKHWLEKHDLIQP